MALATPIAKSTFCGSAVQHKPNHHARAFGDELSPTTTLEMELHRHCSTPHFG
jgi:hypothetical protein